jgi:hypothetical protein
MKPLSIACLSLLTIASISSPAFSKPKEVPHPQNPPVLCVYPPCPTYPPTRLTHPPTTETTVPKIINQDRTFGQKDRDPVYPGDPIHRVDSNSNRK